jgi:hypothetical protein
VAGGFEAEMAGFEFFAALGVPFAFFAEPPPGFCGAGTWALGAAGGSLFGVAARSVAPAGGAAAPGSDGGAVAPAPPSAAGDEAPGSDAFVGVAAGALVESGARA